MSVLALISDLMMQSQASSAAQRAGVTLRVVSSADALLEQATQMQKSEAPIELIVVDLSHPGLDPAGLMERLRPALSPGTATLAFGPHVHKARLEAAAAAGFASVMSRGQFHANMVSLLAGTIEPQR